MSEHRFCENRFRANEQEIEKLKKTNAALLEAAKHLFIFNRIIQADPSLDETFEKVKDELRQAIAEAEGKS